MCDSSTIDNIAKEFCKDENSKLKVMGSLVPSKVRKTWFVYDHKERL